ncbi:MAG: LD-carboxypeptidase [Acidobacteriota bacterium]|nr:LD-carboxypeptidase [Acidobacteriota bacterium]
MTLPALAPLKPAALRPGATLGIVSPASTPRRELVELGLAQLQQLGYRTVVFPHALQRGPLYYAGTLHQRLADLQDAFADPTIDAVLCTRGGWGSAELLPLLSAEVFRKNPKPFIGYSDHTSLHLWLQAHTGMVTFHGPMLAADFARVDGVHRTSWVSSLSHTSPWSLDHYAGLRVLRPGVATGRLQGGCLTLLAESLGTPYAPYLHDTILWLEDIGTKPFQWDRMLLHLRYAGMLQGVNGIVFGDMSQCVAPDDMELVESAILHALRDFVGPIAIGLQSGHVSAPNVTLPLGVKARLDLTHVGYPQLHLLESAVTV